MKKVILSLLPACLIMVAMCGCSEKGGEYRQAKGSCWGTFYNITYCSDTDLTDSINAVLAQVDGTLSVFNESSLTSRINRGEDVTVDSLFVTVFNAAKEVSRLSDGYFDPTVSPLINLWGFGYEEGSEAPTDEQIAAALATVGIAECSIDSGKVTKKAAETTFNFSAIAKGYGCDLVARMLERNGCDNYLIEIGGEMALKGVNNRGEKWHIQVDAPVESTEEIVHEQATVIAISDCGVATSGNYRNFHKNADGTSIGHTISPLTGKPVQGELLGVTIIAPDAMWADALATACMAMPLDKAKVMIESLEKAEALFITPGTDGKAFTLTYTANFPKQ